MHGSKLCRISMQSRLHSSALAFVRTAVGWSVRPLEIASWMCSCAGGQDEGPHPSVKSPACDIGHLARHDGHELHVRIQRKIGHIQHRFGDMFYVESRLDLDRAVRLRRALGHSRSHIGRCVADVYLATSDVLLPAVQRGGLGEARNPVLCGRIRRRVRTRHMSGDRAVVDDPPAHWVLGFHDLDRFLRAQECTCKVSVDNPLPVFVGQLFQRHPWCTVARVIEEHAECE